MKAAISRFRRRIDELEAFDPNNVQTRSDPKIDTLEAAIDETLSETFGHGTPSYWRYASARHLDTAPISYARQIPMRDVIRGLVAGKERAIALLGQAVRSLEERVAELEEPAALEDAATASADPSLDVFIVHGHDGPAKIEVARLIELAGLNAVILHEQPNSGRTALFEELFEIADKPCTNQGEVQQQRNRLDTRKWALSKLAPRKYGDRVEHDHKGGANFQPAILIQVGSNEREDDARLIEGD
jgi:hypothetical protein